MQEHLTKPIEPARLYAALAHWGQRTVEAADNPPAGAAERVAAALRERDDPAARQITHTVKGVAANLEATALSDAASRLENTLQAGQPSDDDLDLFRRTLAETVALIRGLSTTGRPLAGGSGESDAKIGAAASLEAAIPSSAELVERLRALLQSGDGEAIDVVQAHRASLQRLLGATSFRAMESELERFAFEAAAAALEAMIEAGSGRHFDPSVVSAFLSEAKTFGAIARRFQDERPVRPLRRPGPAPAAADTPGSDPRHRRG
jgi:chemotaxis protein histidine kinase CheA